jgi:hypothetical protein
MEMDAFAQMMVLVRLVLRLREIDLVAVEIDHEVGVQMDIGWRNGLVREPVEHEESPQHQQCDEDARGRVADLGVHAATAVVFWNAPR